jgi:2-keto-4-pentenoate hydratase/2-oxohepta-3-ene-1,7-dioic acid hydratase in catechol pathway
MLFDVRYLIARASEGVTLEPGTIVLTGTPAGPAVGEQGDDKWIKDGEEYSVFLSHGIGTLINRYEFE